MPATHVLKTPDGRTVTEIVNFDHVSGMVGVTLRGELGLYAFRMKHLVLVPRAELLAGQVA